MPTIAENLARVRQRIDAAAARAGLSPDAVRLVTVTKTHPVELVREAVAAGATDLGENRIQEAVPKIEALAAAGGASADAAPAAPPAGT